MSTAEKQSQDSQGSDSSSNSSNHDIQITQPKDIDNKKFIEALQPKPNIWNARLSTHSTEVKGEREALAKQFNTTGRNN